MNENDFEKQLRADGFEEIEHQNLEPRPGKGGHRHHFEIRGLVISGKRHNTISPISEIVTLAPEQRPTWD